MTEPDGPIGTVSKKRLAVIFPINRQKQSSDSRLSTPSVFGCSQTQGQPDAHVTGTDGQRREAEDSASNPLDEPFVSAIALSPREIGARTSQEEQLWRLEELARSNVDLEAFAHTVAHDLREPLRTIAAFTQLLARKATIDEEAKDAAAFIVEGVKRMSALLDDLLSNAGYGFHNPLECVELSHAAQQAMQNLTHAITTSGAMITIEQLPAVEGKETDLVRLFQNLLSNALKYRSQAPVKIHVTAEWLEPDWIIRIQDNGIGIPREHQNRIFGLFTRLHAQDIQGTGVGLSVCKRIIEGMGGVIWVESEPGSGSTFCMSIAGSRDARATRFIRNAAQVV